MNHCDHTLLFSRHIHAHTNAYIQELGRGSQPDLTPEILINNKKLKIYIHTKWCWKFHDMNKKGFPQNSNVRVIQILILVTESRDIIYTVIPHV